MEIISIFSSIITLKMFVRVYLLFLFIYKSSGDSANNDPVIEISNGKIRGIQLQNIFNRTFYAFLDIPYASAPIGNLRFKEPTPAKNWTGILNATENRKTCWQFSPDKLSNIKNGPDSNEDCLYANVYMNQLPSSNLELQPVIAYIYGGQFSFNRAWMEDYDPQLLVDSGILYVSFNYRSGPLGFLYTEDGVIPANLGLKDQNFALKWTQKNIRYFGGDPSKVTLMGHSSGAGSVTLHIISKKSAGLFRSAIVQSISAISPLIDHPSSKHNLDQIGKQLSPDYTSRNSSDDFLKLLQNTPMEVLHNITLTPMVRDSVTGKFLPMTWTPTFENAETENAFVTAPLHDNLVDGNFNKIPVLMGVTSEEVLFYSQVLPKETIAKIIDEFPSSLIREGSVKQEERNEIGRKIKSIYTNTTFQENPKNVIRYLSDYIFNIPMIRTATLLSNYNDVYFYQFSFYGEKNNPQEFSQYHHDINVEGLGNVGHAEELRFLYLRGSDRMEREKLYPANDILIRDRLARLWTNFAKYTNPTPAPDPLLQNIHWPKLGEKGKKFSYVDIDLDLSVRQEYLRDYETWSQLIDQYYSRPISYL